MPLLQGVLLMAAIAGAETGAAQLYAGGGAHPRLLCTAAELTEVRGRLDGEVERLAYRKLLEKCDAFLDPTSSLYVDWPERKNHYWRDRSGATWLTKCFEELAWAAVLSGEAKYVEGAKNIVLTIVRERVIDGIAGKNYGRDYGGWLSQPLDAGHSSRSLAVFYDLLHDHLTEGERAEVRDYITGTYLSYFYDYMRKAPESPQYPGMLGHNFALIGNSSAALLTLAVWGETGDAEQERAWLDLFTGGIKQYLDIGIGVDGGALEGAGYTSACLYYLTFPAEALRRADGSEHTYPWMLQGVNDHGFMMSGEGIEIDVAQPFPVVTDTETGWKLRVVMFAAAEPQFTTDSKAIRWNPTAKAVPHPRLKAEVRTAQPPDILTVLLPHREGVSLPEVVRAGTKSVRVRWPGHSDLITFSTAAGDDAQPRQPVFLRK